MVKLLKVQYVSRGDTCVALVWLPEQTRFEAGLHQVNGKYVKVKTKKKSLQTCFFFLIKTDWMHVCRLPQTACTRPPYTALC